jgi:hypothetical protein
MAFFDEAQQALDETIRQLNSDDVTDEVRAEALQLSDEVLAAADQMGGGIPGDIDDQLIKKAKEIKKKLDSGT